MSGPTKVEEVLWDELGHLGHHNGQRPAPGLSEVYAHVGGLPDDGLSALCLSGGGIRSATFNLGVLQALAELGLLGRFDYLSSVSGGGYIAGWLKAWLHREPVEKVVEQLARPAHVPGFRPLAPEPSPVDHLREHSNYLTPRLGLLSADTWSAVAMIVRNMLLNWLVLVPALTAAVAIPQVALIVAVASIVDPGWGHAALGLGLLLALIASIAIYLLRRRRSRETSVLVFAVLPLWLSALCLALTALWLGGGFSPGGLWSVSALWCIGIPLAGWLIARATRAPETVVPPARSDILAIVLSGAVATALLVVVTDAWLPGLLDHPRRFVLFAVPILLGIYLLARTLFVAFASLGERHAGARARGWTSDEGNADREWWARLSGWVLIVSLAWIGLSALVLSSHAWAASLEADGLLTALYGAMGMGTAAASGLLTALLGSSSATETHSDATKRAPSPLREWASRLLAPVSVAGIVFALAALSAWAGRLITGVPDLMRPGAVLHTASVREVLVLVGTFLVVPFGCTLLSWLLGWVVNVNRYSNHGLYRNRLVRAYLGASNLGREPNPFTGFDPDDDLPLHALKKGASPRPLPVVSATLNLMRGSEKLAWQQRKAESFSMTPLYCGNFHEGYRRSDEYGGADGVSLGTALTISGAAANPSAGYHSSPLVSFLMTLFNVRLGAWLGNTNRHGERVYHLSGPRHAWAPLFGDLFSQTDASHAYVSLSDGGHFENLGVYEMVLRRCRVIVASDAGQDPGHDFEDLGNLVRKVRIDFGIPIEFREPIRILARNASEKEGLLCAIATVRYDLVDLGTPPGCLLYLKPTLLAKPPVPYDVFSYARASDDFPHEPTSDQFFSESQFESYRALGYHLASQLAAGPPTSLTAFLDGIRKALEKPRQPAPEVPPPEE